MSCKRCGHLIGYHHAEGDACTVKDCGCSEYLGDNATKQADLKLFMRAMDAWATAGVASVKCDSCGSIIELELNGTTTIHRCECGKFTGVLRGL